MPHHFLKLDCLVHFTGKAVNEEPGDAALCHGGVEEGNRDFPTRVSIWLNALQ